MNVGKLDLFSLQVLIELLEQENVTASAIKLNVSQPKVSRTLTMLRETFNDELLIREQNSMKPTKLAESLYYPAKHLIENYQLIADAMSYHANKNKEINIACQSHFGPIILESLKLTAKELSMDYTFNINPWTDQDQVQRLHSLSQLDYSIAVNPPQSEKINKYLIGTVSKFFLVANRKHPIFTESLDIETALSYPLALLNYCITEQKQHRIEVLAEKLNIPINIILKTMDLDLLLYNLETSNSISYIASFLIKQPVAKRKSLKAQDITHLFSQKGNDIHQRNGIKRPDIGIYLQATKKTPILFTNKLAENLKRMISNLNE
ncbi:LysR family transcriptional regulator [Shewanella sp.]|uniref:LysR family transcriptional regulator n=1 Tax=Shewanella sp. TaxID=50422 RepID=UPI003F39D3E2